MLSPKNEMRSELEKMPDVVSAVIAVLLGFGNSSSHDGWPGRPMQPHESEPESHAQLHLRNRSHSDQQQQRRCSVSAARPRRRQGDD
jgi:hypothetical protein